MKAKRIWLMPGVCIYHDSKDDRLLVADVDLAGVKKEDTKVDINEQRFCIKAKRDSYFYDSCFETAHRIDPARTKASFVEGLLKLRMPIALKTDDMRKVHVE